MMTKSWLSFEKSLLRSSIYYLEFPIRFAQAVAAHIFTHTASVISVALLADAIFNCAAITAKLGRSVAGAPISS